MPASLKHAFPTVQNGDADMRPPIFPCVGVFFISTGKTLAEKNEINEKERKSDYMLKKKIYGRLPQKQSITHLYSAFRYIWNSPSKQTKAVSDSRTSTVPWTQLFLHHQNAHTDCKRKAETPTQTTYASSSVRSMQVRRIYRRGSRSR